MTTQPSLPSLPVPPVMVPPVPPAPALRWKFMNAWPKQYSAPSLSGTATEVAAEELVLVVENFELDAS